MPLYRPSYIAVSLEYLLHEMVIREKMLMLYKKDPYQPKRFSESMTIGKIIVNNNINNEDSIWSLVNLESNMS